MEPHEPLVSRPAPESMDALQSELVEALQHLVAAREELMQAALMLEDRLDALQLVGAEREMQRCLERARLGLTG